MHILGQAAFLDSLELLPDELGVSWGQPDWCFVARVAKCVDFERVHVLFTYDIAK